MNPPVEQEAPEHVWITWDDAYPWPEPTEDATEYIRADLARVRADSGGGGVTLKITKCGECPFIDHSGAFTPGGAQATCNHRDAPDTFAAGVKGDDRYHWKHRKVDRNAAPPAQCPIRTVAPAPAEPTEPAPVSDAGSQRTYRDRWCEHCQATHRYFTGWANERNDHDRLSDMQTEQHRVSQALPKMDTGFDAAAKTGCGSAQACNSAKEEITAPSGAAVAAAREIAKELYARNSDVSVRINLPHLAAIITSYFPSPVVRGAERPKLRMADPKPDTDPPACAECGRLITQTQYGPPINDASWSHVHNGVVWCNWPVGDDSAPSGGSEEQG